MAGPDTEKEAELAASIQAGQAADRVTEDEGPAASVTGKPASETSQSPLSMSEESRPPAGGPVPGGDPSPPKKRNLAREHDVLAAKVEGLAVMLRDMARVALAAAALAAVALMIALYGLKMLRALQNA